MPTNDALTKGWVFNIQHYSLHDGAGIRTVVFLKGCPLRCDWCSNPESQHAKAQLSSDPGKCLGNSVCGWCRDKCPEHAISFDSSGKVQVFFDKCSDCLICVPYCPTKALSYFGSQMGVNQVLDIVESNAVFYQRSKGGLTLSGGEPLQQPKFTIAILKEAKKRKINTILETCGQGSWQHLREIALNVDGVYYDIKSMNEIKHRKFTAQGNSKIIDNLISLNHHFPNLPIQVRTPLIPDFNDTHDELNAIIDLVKSLPGTRFEILPYHRLGKDKYRLLGRNYTLEDKAIPDDFFSSCVRLAKQRCGDLYGPQ